MIPLALLLVALLSLYGGYRLRKPPVKEWEPPKRAKSYGAAGARVRQTCEGYDEAKASAAYRKSLTHTAGGRPIRLKGKAPRAPKTNVAPLVRRTGTR